jgi:hypothetical protein
MNRDRVVTMGDLLPELVPMYRSQFVYLDGSDLLPAMYCIINAPRRM